MEHVETLLSAFHDGQLPEAERKMVEAHLGHCAECRKAHEEIQAVSKMVAGLPQRPLPTGFRERLENKRRRIEEGEKKQAASLFPFPTRVAAFAAAAFFVCLVGYDGLRSRQEKLAPMDLDSGSPAMPAESAPAQSQAFDGAAPASPAASRARQEVRARGKPLGIIEAQRATQFAGKPYTNEKLVDLLDKERDKMGIQAIIPPGYQGEEGAPPRQPQPQAEPEPMSKDEAHAYMRQMAMDLAIQRRMMQAVPDGVALGRSSKPQLISKAKQDAASGGAPLEGAPAISDIAGSNMVAGAGAGGAASYRGVGVRGASGSLSAAGRVKKAALPVESFTLKDGGFALRSPADILRFWQALGKTEPPPAVDFSVEMVVGIYAAHAPSGTQFEILSTDQEGSKLVVRYRELPSSPAKPGTAPAYALRVVPLTKMPVEYKKAP